MIDVFVIDPPWAKKKGGIRKERPNQGRELDYKTMPTESIFQVLDAEVFVDASPVHAVFMWAIEQYLCECDDYMIERGYKRHCRFVWDKGNGVAPAFTVRYSHEYLIWYYKPSMLPISSDMRGKFKTVFSEKPREHSRKPDAAYDMIQFLYPHQTKIDVFSREKRVYYAQFGNEVDYFK